MSTAANDAKRFTAPFEGKNLSTLERATAKTNMSNAAFITAASVFVAELVNSGKALMVNGRPELKGAAQ